MAGAGGVQRGGSDMCILDANGDIQCRNLPPLWKLRRKGPFKAFVLDGSRGCGLSEDGSAQCWEGSAASSLGLCPGNAAACLNGGVPPGDKFAQLSIFGETACGVTLDGRLLCWGEKRDGRELPPAGSDFVQVVLGYDVSCALRRDGTASCWAALPSSDAKSISGQGVQLALGDETICLLRADGSLHCEGRHADLARDPQARDLAQINLNRYALCGLTKSGAASCWGVNTDAFTRTLPPIGPFKAIYAEPQHACGLRGDLQLECWGYFWGNGGDSERCLLSNLRLSLDGMAEQNQGLGPFTDNRTGDAGVRSGASAGKGYLLVQGGGVNGRDLRSATADGGTIDVESSYWLLDEGDAGAGEVYCTAPGSTGRIERKDDELLVDVPDLSALGRCPGSESVAGSLSVCIGSSCSNQALTGTLRAESKNVTPVENAGSTQRPVLGFRDGSVLLAYAGLDNQARWALLISAPDSSGQSEVICAGSASFASNTWTLADLSTLGRCKSGGTHTLKGCLR